MFKGIDVSIHNGKIDYNKVKNDGVKAVIIKATEGVDFTDKMVNQHYEGARDSGLNIGFYHFMSEKTNPSEQARDFWGVIKDKKFNIIPCLDIETNNQGRNRKQISDRCIEFLEEFKRLSGFDCMIYTGGYFGRDNLDDRVKKYPGWIAHYGVEKPMNTGFEVVGHQYTEDGKINGINTRCDVNNFTEKIYIDKAIEVKPSTPSKPQDKKLWEISISGQEVKNLQSELNRQCGTGLNVDGYFGESTLDACITVREGAKGNITRLIQQRLLNRGYTSLKEHGGADGCFGGGTTTAIRNLQKNKGIGVDGIVGRNTWKALYSK